MSPDLVLSIFPGIDLLGRAFEEEGYTVVRGPDLIWGGDIRGWHPPAGVFGGIIGGPPCQHWTRLMFLNKNAGKGMEWVVGEFARVVEDAQPEWFLMEEVLYAPMPLVQGYHVFDVILSDESVGGSQPRERRFSFGTRDSRMLHVVLHEQSGNGQAQSVLADSRAVPVRIGGSGKEKRSITTAGGGTHGGGRGEGWEGGRLPGGGRRSVLADSRMGSSGSRVRGGGGVLPHSESGSPARVMPIEDACEAMGLPRNFTDHMPFTMHGKRSMLGNGVPMAMGRAVAQAVRRATEG